MEKLYDGDVWSQCGFVDSSEVIYIAPKNKMGACSSTDWILFGNLNELKMLLKKLL